MNGRISGNLTPVETRYKGYRFRSRLEARWAVFFDAMGWHWEYEPEGYDLGDDGWYLPDFRLHGCGRMAGLYEVKPILPSEREKRIARAVDATILVGQPYIDERDSLAVPLICHYIALVWEDGFDPQFADVDQWRVDGEWQGRHINECRYCSHTWALAGPSAEEEDAYTIAGVGAVLAGTSFTWGICSCNDKDIDNTVLSDRLRSAYIAARSARFEHGEAPHTEVTNGA